MSTTSDSQPAPTLFTRKATGLVREARTTDALFYNVMWASVALAFAFFWLLYGFAYQGSNAWVAFLIAAGLGVPGAFLYAMLAQIMPRTGGDYVFNSRSLHPSIGFAAQLQLLLLARDHLRRLHDLPRRLRLRRLRPHDGRVHRLARLARLRRLVLEGLRAVHHRHGRAAALGRRSSSSAALRLFLRLQVGALRALRARRVPACRCSSGCSRARPASSRNFNDYAANLGTPQRDRRARRLGRRKRGSRQPDSTLETTLKSVSVFWYIFGFLYSSNYFAGEIRLRKRTHLRLDPRRARWSRRRASRCCCRPTCTSPATRSTGGSASPTRPRTASPPVRPPTPRSWRSPPAAGSSARSMIVGFAVGLLIWLPQTMLLDQPQHVRVVVRPDHARAPVLRRPAHALAGRRDRDRDACWRSAARRSTRSRPGSARSRVLLGLSLDAARDRGRRHRCCPFRQRAMVENSPYGAQASPGSRSSDASWRPRR